MKQGILYFLLAATAISYGLYILQGISLNGIVANTAVQSGSLTNGVGRTAVVETKEVNLNQFIELYQQNNFSKIELKDGVKLEGFQLTSGGKAENPLLGIMGVKIDTQYKVITTNKPVDTSLAELGFQLTGTGTPINVIFEKTGMLEKLFLDQVVPLLFFVLLLILLSRLMGGKMGGGLPFSFKAGILRTKEESKTKFTDVAGMTEVKQELVEIVDYLKSPKKYQDV
jgi:ATP-dependent Zn protease